MRGGFLGWRPVANFHTPELRHLRFGHAPLDSRAPGGIVGIDHPHQRLRAIHQRHGAGAQLRFGAHNGLHHELWNVNRNEGHRLFLPLLQIAKSIVWVASSTLRMISVVRVSNCHIVLFSALAMAGESQFVMVRKIVPASLPVLRFMLVFMFNGTLFGGATDSGEAWMRDRTISARASRPSRSHAGECRSPST